MWEANWTRLSRWWSSILCWPSPEFCFAIALVVFLGPGLDRLIFALASIGWVVEAVRAPGAPTDGFIF